MADTPAPLNLVIANLSATLDDATFAAAVAAIATQVSRDFQPEWGAAATIAPKRLALDGGRADIDGAADAIVYVGDVVDDPTTGIDDVYGYHSHNHGQKPYAFVYLDICMQNNEPWTCTLSHEVLELLADPAADRTVIASAPGPAATGLAVDYDIEVCDPTQGDTYVIDTITVANFVTRRYFGMTGPSAATNFLGLALDPLGVRPGGYLQYEDPGGAHVVNGQEVTPARLAARVALGRHRRTARRAARRTARPPPIRTEAP